MSVQERLFILIRSGLYNTSPQSDAFVGLGEDDWRQIYRLAIGGAVVSLCLDAIERLEKAVKPPRNLLLEWYALAEKRQEHNRRCESVLKDIAELYTQNDIGFVLLKGLGVARLYHNPLLRDGGDIDLLITRNIDRANELLVDGGGKVLEDNVKHKTFAYRGVTIENHFQLAMIPKVSKILNTLLQDTATIDEGIMVPTSMCNSVYLTEHIAMHFFVSGIGFRHLCDLCLLFTKGDIDLVASRDYIHKIGAEPLFARLAAIMVRHMGVEQSALPIAPVYDKFTDMVLSDVVNGGNFGFMNSRNRSKNKWIHKAVSMWIIMCRGIKYLKIGGGIFMLNIEELLVFNFKRIFGLK